MPSSGILPEHCAAHSPHTSLSGFLKHFFGGGVHCLPFQIKKYIYFHFTEITRAHLPAYESSAAGAPARQQPLSSLSFSLPLSTPRSEGPVQHPAPSRGSKLFEGGGCFIHCCFQSAWNPLGSLGIY